PWTGRRPFAESGRLRQQRTEFGATMGGDCLCGKTSGRVSSETRPLNCSGQAGLEPVLDTNVPEPAFRIRRLFVNPVFERCSHKWRRQIHYVIHTQGNGGVVQPRSPSAWVEFRG